MTFSNVTERTFLNRPRTEFPFFLNSPFSSFRVLLDGRAVCFTTIIFFEKFLAYHYTIIVSPFQLFFLSLCFSLSLSISLSQSLSLSITLSTSISSFSLFLSLTLSLSLTFISTLPLPSSLFFLLLTSDFFSSHFFLFISTYILSFISLDVIFFDIHRYMLM